MSKYSHFNIVPLNPGIWEVELEIDADIGDDADLIFILHDAKKKIVEQYGASLSDLKYKDIRRKQKSDAKLDISFTIESGKYLRGAPKLKTVKLTSGEGIEYDDMALYIDIYPSAPSNRNISSDDIISLLNNNNIALNQTILDSINTYVDRVIQENTPLLNLHLMQGLFPEESRDAELKYNCRIKKTSAEEFIGVDKVVKGQLICSKSPACRGVRCGRDVKGRELLPRQPADIEIAGGENVKVSPDGNQVFAGCDGILHAVVSKSSLPNFSSKLIFSLEPLQKYDGSEVLSITVDKPIEIKGGLKAGSKIISQREVIITGDIESGTSIQTSGSIHIEGNIVGSTLTSAKDIETERNVNSSKLTAEGRLIIKGSAINCDLIGHEVFVNEASGCNITAGNKIEVNKIACNERGYCGFFKTGILCHLNEISAENRKFIEFAQLQLKKVESVFGSEIVSSINSMNIAQMMVKHSENLKKMGILLSSVEQKDAVKQLMGAISPIRELAAEKEKTLQKIEKQKKNTIPSAAKIIFNSKVPHPVEIEIDGVRDLIKEEDGSVECALVSEKIIKQPVHSFN